MLFLSGTYGYYGIGYSRQLPPANAFRFACFKKYGHDMYYDSVSLNNNNDPRFKNAMITWKKKFINPGFNFSTTGNSFESLLAFYTPRKMLQNQKFSDMD